MQAGVAFEHRSPQLGAAEHEARPGVRLDAVGPAVRNDRDLVRDAERVQLVEHGVELPAREPAVARPPDPPKMPPARVVHRRVAQGPVPERGIQLHADEAAVQHRVLHQGEGAHVLGRPDRRIVGPGQAVPPGELPGRIERNERVDPAGGRDHDGRRDVPHLVVDLDVPGVAEPVLVVDHQRHGQLDAVARERAHEPVGNGGKVPLREDLRPAPVPRSHHPVDQFQHPTADETGRLGPRPAPDAPGDDRNHERGDQLQGPRVGTRQQVPLQGDVDAAEHVRVDVDDRLHGDRPQYATNRGAGHGRLLAGGPRGSSAASWLVQLRVSGILIP